MGRAFYKQSQPAEHRGHVAFLCRGIIETSRCEDCSIQSSETASRNNQGKDERPNGTEHLSAKGDCYGSAGGRDAKWEHEEVGDVRQEIRGDDDDERTVNHAGQVSRRIYQLPGDVADLARPR